jgi:hypothetical protein
MSEKIIHIDSVIFSHFEYTKECDRSILAAAVSYLLFPSSETYARKLHRKKERFAQ